MIGTALAIAGVVLVVSGAAKVADAGPARAFIASSVPVAPWLPPGLLGVGEIAIGLSAVVVGGRAVAALVALTYAAFAALVLRLLRRGDRRPCGCLGRGSAPVSVRHLVIDVGLVVLAVAALVRPPAAPLTGYLGGVGVLPLLVVCVGSGAALLAMTRWSLAPSFLAEGWTRRQGVGLPRSWVDARIRVAGGRWRSRGLVADAQIEAGETVIVLAGRQVPSARPARFAARRARGRTLRIEDGLHLVQGPDDPATRQRHACDPTTWLDGAFSIVARRRIEAQEAITIDLATLIADPAGSVRAVATRRAAVAGCRETTGRDLTYRPATTATSCPRSPPGSGRSCRRLRQDEAAQTAHSRRCARRRRRRGRAR